MADSPAYLFIDGVDQSFYLDASTLSIKNQLTRAVDTCDFTLYDWDSGLAAISFDPNELEVQVKDTAGTVLFGGYIKVATQITKPINGDYRNCWHCSANDYTDLLLRTRVTRTWTNSTDADIIADALGDLRPDVNATTYVDSSGSTFARFVANRITLAELLDKIAQATGFDWYVDSDKNLRYFAAETFAAPFGLSGSPDESALSGPTWGTWQFGSNTTAAVVSTTETTASVTPGAVAMSYGGAVTNHARNLTDSGLLCEVTSYVKNGAAADYESDILAALDPTDGAANAVGFQVLGGNLRAVKRVGGGTTSLASATLNTTNHRWLWLQERSGVTYWYTSPDGYTWTLFHSVANPLAVTRVYVYIFAGYFDSGNNGAQPTLAVQSIGLPPKSEYATYAPIDFEYEKNTQDLANLVTVVGGTKRSVDSTFYLAGNNVTTELLLPYQLHAPDGFTAIQVAYNTGSDASPVWTSKTVGIDNVDKLTSVQVLYNFTQKLLKFAVAPPALNKAVRVIGQYDVPILVRRRSYASNAQYGDWYEAKVVDASIVDDTVAQETARAVLAERAFHKEFLRFRVLTPGLRAGQTIYVTDTDKGIDAAYTIQAVTVSVRGGDLFTFDVQAGEHNPDLVRLLIDVRRRQLAESTDDSDNVVTELIDTGDTLSLVGVYSATQGPTGPFNYSLSAGSLDAHSFVWGLMLWA